MKIKMPFCTDVNTGVPWDSGLPFLRALGPAHNLIKTTACCFVPFEFCADKNTSDIKCVSLEVVALLDGGRFTVSACFPSFKLSSANTSCHIRSMNIRVSSSLLVWSRWDNIPRVKHTHVSINTHKKRVCFFSVSCTCSLKDVSQSQLSESTERHFMITGCLKWYQACYVVTHPDRKKKKTVLFLNCSPVQTPPHLKGGFAPPKRKTSTKREFSDLRGDREPESPAGS